MNKLTKIDCVEMLALKIIKRGERNHIAQYSLMLSEFVNEPGLFNFISDYLFRTEKITHYDLMWCIPLKTVYVNLYKGDSFGACWPLPKHYETVEVDLVDVINRDKHIWILERELDFSEYFRDNDSSLGG